MNPFEQVKDPVTIEIMKEVAKNNRKKPIQMIEELVNDTCKRLR